MSRWKAGRRVGTRFVVRGHLASGGMAEVYVAEMQLAKGVRRAVALKRVHAHLTSEPELITMFLDEARVTGHLTHPCVIPLLDVFDEDGELVMALEYVPGWDLAAVMNRAEGPMPLAAALHVARQIAECLGYVHAARDVDGRRLGVVHRDVTPSNVLLAEDGTVRLLDFGIAKAVERATHTATDVLKGKAYYMAPEQVRGSAVDGRTDLYALGLVLFEMLTGRRAIDAPDRTAAILRARDPSHRPPSELRPGLPGDLDALVTRLLAVDPGERPEDGRQVASALAALGSSVGGDGSARTRAWVREVMGEQARPVTDVSAAFERALRRSAALAGGPAGTAPGPAVDALPAVAPHGALAEPPDAAAGSGPAEAGEGAGGGAGANERAPATGVRRRALWGVGALAVVGVVAGAAWVAAGDRGDARSDPTETEPVTTASPSPGAAFLRIRSRPAGAAVRVDGERLDEPTPTVAEVAGGERHLVELSLEDHQTAMRSVTSEPGELSELDVELAPAPGRIVVRSDPAGAHVTLAGSDAGVTPVELEGLERGEHAIALSLEGHRTEERTVDLADQPSAELDVTLHSRQPAGLLDVSSTPWARVSVDGRVVAESTPVVGLRLSPGVHVVTLVNPRLGLRETRRVRIRDGQRSRIVTDLR